MQPRVTTAQRVVLMSFDGLGADALARQTGLPGFERLARESASARIIPVTPTSTVPAHVAILTGAGPQKTGIVANRFHLPGTPPEQEARGLMVDPDVESIVEAARRQGKRVGAVPFPSIDGQSARRTADFGLAWSNALVPGRVITFKREDFKREWVPPTWTPRPQRRQSFSPVMRARLEWAVPDATAIDVDLVAYDLTNDAVENYDAIFLESGDFEATPDAAGWFPISMRIEGTLHGSWSKLLRADARLNDVAIYWGPVNRNQAWPESFAAMVDEHAGFWPGEPDERLDPWTFTEQMNRLTDFLTKAQTVAMQRMQSDLLLMYQPVIDEAAHPFLNRNEAIVRDSFLAADRAMNAIRQLIDPAREAFIVTGDHGLMPREREIRMNALLPPGWRAFANGHVAHIYGSGDVEAVVNLLTASGYFERIERKFHPNAGDIVVYAYPANVLTPSSEQPAVIERAGGGQHGALNTHRELHTVLFAIAPGVDPVPLGEIAQTKIARFVASVLGIAPPAAAE
jgi:Type I phosphodiesterase / nucleotide pyrophosphatase